MGEASKEEGEKEERKREEVKRERGGKRWRENVEGRERVGQRVEGMGEKF